MFCRITVISTVALLSGVSLVFLNLAWPHAEDRETYKNLVAAKAAAKPPKNMDRPPAHQVRHAVQKDFWDQSLRHTRLKSENSDLWIRQSKNKFEISENLETLECCIQDNSPDKEPEIQWITASFGCFAYPTGVFEAKDVHLTIFAMPENQFPDVMPTTSPKSSIKADYATWEQPHAIHLTGNIHLFSDRFQEKPLFSIADELTFHPSEGLLELRGNESQNVLVPDHKNFCGRVLIWRDDMQLSSPIVEIKRDPKEKTEQIQGIGDVHLYWNVEEEEMFRKVFGK